MKSISVPVIATFVWSLIALGIDRLILSVYFPHYAKMFVLELSIKLPAAELTFPPVSLIVLVLMPMVVLALYLTPWRKMYLFNAWREAFAIWSQPWFWLIVALVLTVVGESVFILAKDYLPKAVTGLARSVSVIATLSFSGNGFTKTSPLVFSASLFGFLGLLVGSYLFFKNGLRDVFK